MDIASTEHKEIESKPILNYARRLRVWETNYGRDTGWILERWGEPVALFTECENIEMFWDSYRLTSLTQDIEVQKLLYTKSFWNEMKGLAWRNHEFGLVAPHAFSGGFELPETGRVSMRSLYINIEPPRPWDQVVLWLRKINREAKD